MAWWGWIGLGIMVLGIDLHRSRGSYANPWMMLLAAMLWWSAWQ